MRERLRFFLSSPEAGAAFFAVLEDVSNIQLQSRSFAHFFAAFAPSVDLAGAFPAVEAGAFCAVDVGFGGMVVGVVRVLVAVG